jgi:hypothetical protein
MEKEKKFKIVDNGIFEKSLENLATYDMLTPMEALQIHGGSGLGVCIIQACGAKACGCDGACVGNVGAV